MCTIYQFSISIYYSRYLFHASEARKADPAFDQDNSSGDGVDGEEKAVLQSTLSNTATSDTIDNDDDGFNTCPIGRSGSPVAPPESETDPESDAEEAVSVTSDGEDETRESNQVHERGSERRC